VELDRLNANSFDEAHEEIMGLLAKDTFRRYRRSPAYAEEAALEEKEDDPPSQRSRSGAV